MFTFYIELAFAVVAGLVSHWMFFIRKELDLAAANISRFYIIAGVLIPITKCKLEDMSFKVALGESFCINTVYCCALFGSITVYRLFLSEVRHIPGPLRLRLTKLSHMWDMARFQNCKLLDDLRTKYGDAVRTGPNEVTLFGVEAFYKVYGSESTCKRAVYYDLLHPMVSLDTTRNPEIHSQMRKVWDQAFSIKALSRLEPIIYEEADELIKQLRKREDEPIDISAWFEYYTFDLMGRFGLATKFSNLSKGEPHPILSIYHMAHKRLGPLGAVPWVKHMMMGIPYIERMRYYRQFMDWAADELDRNIKDSDKERSDVIGYVLRDAEENGGIELNWRFILGDFVLNIAAGSDPMRQVLANMMYYLVHQPKHINQIRDELASINIRDYRAIQRLPHLNACIYETLRLNPAVPAAGLRVTPHGGLMVGNTHIPEGMTVLVPQYSLFRDPRCFESPEEWIPERFTTQPILIHNKQAFMPWSAGTYACIGKNLSLMEIRVAATLMLTTFEIEFAPGEDGERMFEEACDYFTTTPGPLKLVLKPRAIV